MQLPMGILGVGHFGRFHALKVAASPRARLVGVHDADPARAAAVAAELGVPAMPAEALIEAAAAVVVAAPTRAHFALADAALRAGRHVLVEKPIAATAEEAGRLVALAAERGLVLQVGHLERFSAGQAALRDGGVGRPLYMEAVRVAPFRPRSLDVSVVLDLMIHDLDLVLELAGSPIESVDAVGAAVFSPHPDIANARLRFRNGAVATVTASRANLVMERRLSVFGTEGHLSVDFLARSLRRLRRGAGEAVEALPGFGAETRSWQDHDSLEAEQAAFVASVLDGAPVVVDGQAGLRALAAASQVEAGIAASLARVRESGLLAGE
ncbi:Gfo/Idh/MocA family oxidoreductase [Roseomonas sp. NAR14]|uniref:Gfo/Idh/MocA family oxidoreductase n=1 Tax=Roseomonas acroporae TaxID=2937791 RepID=A0A9X2BUV0_9PROT|nr:Gfo/Idh/MocA family oxidoreductase [Roseomonas acroporae]MCK8784481.1 Gfo/Idh/MocA family oxidoreductase [Roseomonas acroporae]